MSDPFTDLEINCRPALDPRGVPAATTPRCGSSSPARARSTAGRSYLPVDEAHPIAPVDVNGINKTAGEWYHLLYGRVYGLPVTVLRLTNTYGPRMRVRDARQTFLGVWLRQALAGEEIEVFGDGTPAARLHLRRRRRARVPARGDAPAEAVGEVFNVGGGRAREPRGARRARRAARGLGRLPARAVPRPTARRSTSATTTPTTRKIRDDARLGARGRARGGPRRDARLLPRARRARTGATHERRRSSTSAPARRAPRRSSTRRSPRCSTAAASSADRASRSSRRPSPRTAAPREAVGVASGTDAIAIALRALGVEPGDEVITPANTCVPTVAGDRGGGATPGARRRRRATWTLDPGELERRDDAAHAGDRPGPPLRPVRRHGRDRRRTRAEHGLAVVEDAAQAHGAALRRPARRHARRRGGVQLLSRRRTSARSATAARSSRTTPRSRRLRGRCGATASGGGYESVRRGWNSRLDALQAAVLLGQAAAGSRAGTSAGARSRALLPHGSLAGVDGARRGARRPHHVYHLFVVRSPRPRRARRRARARGSRRSSTILARCTSTRPTRISPGRALERSERLAARGAQPAALPRAHRRRGRRRRRPPSARLGGDRPAGATHDARWWLKAADAADRRRSRSRARSAASGSARQRLPRRPSRASAGRRSRPSGSTSRKAGRVRRRGWDVETVAEAYREKWPRSSALEGPGPLGVNHEVRAGEPVAARRRRRPQHARLVRLRRSRCVAHGRDRLSVLDWGGGLGHYAVLARAVLPEVELDALSGRALGRGARARGCPEVTFHDDDACLDRTYDLVLATGSLQYARGLAGRCSRRLAAATSGLLSSRASRSRSRRRRSSSSSARTLRLRHRVPRLGAEPGSCWPRLPRPGSSSSASSSWRLGSRRRRARGSDRAPRLPVPTCSGDLRSLSARQDPASNSVERFLPTSYLSTSD